MDEAARPAGSSPPAAAVDASTATTGTDAAPADRGVAADARRARATAIGGLAILIWSTLALLTTLARAIPPFQLVASAFTIAFLLALGRWLATGAVVRAHFRLPWPVWVAGVAGLFGNHFCYFMALRLAPPAEANLVNYLWPLLIVVLSGLLLKGERLTLRHLVGGLAGFAGCTVVIGGSGEVGFSREHTAGYAFALGAACSWAGYSLASRRFAHVPTDAVGAFCAATALLAWACHFALEATHRPRGIEMLVIGALGVGPIGSAFFAWDHGVKKGDIGLLSTAAYAIPLMSTGLLIASGFAEPTPRLALALVLIVGGAVLAASGRRGAG